MPMGLGMGPGQAAARRAAGLPADPHRFWQMRILTHADSYPALNHLSFAAVAGGPSVATGGTAFSCAAYDPPAVAFAIPPNLNNNWTSRLASGTYIGYDFGEGNAKTIVEASFHTRIDNYGLPLTGVFEYSDDGITYTEAGTFDSSGIGPNETRAYAVSGGYSDVGSGGSGGGSGGTVGAVTIDGGTDISNPSLVAVNSPYVVINFWARYANATSRDFAFPFLNDQANAAGIGTFNKSGGADAGKQYVFFQDENANTDNFLRMVAPDQTPTGQWLHYLIVYRGLTRNGHSNECTVYRNRVQLAMVYNIEPSVPIIPTFNGKSMDVGYYPGAPADYADMFIHLGHDLMEADGSVSSANLDKFVTSDLKPVYLGADGSTPLGTAPVMFLHRDVGADPATFATNLGTGGAFTLTETLTAAAIDPGA